MEERRSKKETQSEARASVTSVFARDEHMLEQQLPTVNPDVGIAMEHNQARGPTLTIIPTISSSLFLKTNATNIKEEQDTKAGTVTLHPSPTSGSQQGEIHAINKNANHNLEAEFACNISTLVGERTNQGPEGEPESLEYTCVSKNALPKLVRELGRGNASAFIEAGRCTCMHPKCTLIKDLKMFLRG